MRNNGIFKLLLDLCGGLYHWLRNNLFYYEAEMKDFLELLLTLAVAVWYYLPLAAGAVLITAGTESWRVGLGAACLAIFIVQRIRP